MTNRKVSAGVLGAGISGLATAYALQQRGIPTVVYEKSNRVGGAIHSLQKDGWLVEEGPNTLMIKSKAVWDLLDQLDLKKKVSEANSAAKKRFIVKNSQPVALPSSLANFLTSPLLSPKAKLRLFKEPFVAATKQDDESIASFIERRLGKQPLDYGVNPFVSGIYAGDPQNLSVKHTFSMLWKMEQQHGSITKGILKRKRSDDSPKRALISFGDGLEALPKALAGFLGTSIKLSTEVTSVQQEGNRWLVSGLDSGDEFEHEHDCLIPTLPAYTLPNLFETNLFEGLSRIPYPSLSVFALGFKKSQINHPLDGFGMLIPEIEQFKTLGVLFSSTLFANRAPQDHALLTCFIGGARNPDRAKRSPKNLQEIILEELGALLGIKGEPVFVHHKFWPKAIPQYEVGYDHFQSLMEDIERRNKGLFLSGNFRGGVSVPDCITSGFEMAKGVSDFLITT